MEMYANEVETKERVKKLTTTYRYVGFWLKPPFPSEFPV